MKQPFQYEHYTLHQSGGRKLHSGRHTLTSGDWFEFGTLSSIPGDAAMNGYGQLHRRDVILLPPNVEIHLQIRGGTAQYVFIRLSIHDDEETPLFSSLNRMTQPFVASHSMSAEAGGEVVERVVQEATSDHMYGHLLIGSYINQLLVNASRQLLQSRVVTDYRAENYGRVRTRKDIARQALAYIDHQYMELRDLREIATMMGYSYSYVSHIVREEVGISLQGYYTNKKIKKAMQMLTKNRHSVTRIAEILQYQSIHSFSKAFKRFTGLTPTEYQQQFERNKVSI